MVENYWEEEVGEETGKKKWGWILRRGSGNIYRKDEVRKDTG